MKKPVILHCIDSLCIGGAETVLLTTIKKLPDYDHHVITLKPDIELHEFNEFASLHCVHHTGWIRTVETCSKLRKLIRQLNPAIIHAHLFLTSFLLRLALNHRYNFVYSIHNLYSATIFKNPHLKLMEKWIYHSSQKLISVSNYVLNDYRKVVTKCKSGKVLYNFIDDSFLEPLIGKQVDFPSKWVSVGSLKKQKNYEAMIICLETLYKAYPQKKISLDIYGEGPLKSVLEKMICNLPFISLKGKANNISNILDQYDAYISTSEYEGYGIAPMEALARGLPLFLSDIPVYREIYKEHAFFFSTDKSADSFLKSFEQYKLQNVAEKEKRRIEGHYYAQKIANSKGYISQLLTIYGS